jgi:neurofibromin 1
MFIKVVSTVKLMAENTQIALEEVVNVDIGPVTVAMARRIARCYGVSGQRLRIKYCNLCESIGSRSDNICLRIDSTTRHEILGFIIQWMDLPKVRVFFFAPHV